MIVENLALSDTRQSEQVQKQVVCDLTVQGVQGDL